MRNSFGKTVAAKRNLSCIQKPIYIKKETFSAEQTLPFIHPYLFSVHQNGVTKNEEHRTTNTFIPPLVAFPIIEQKRNGKLCGVIQN